MLAAEIRRLQPSFLLPQHPDDLLLRTPSARYVRLQTSHGRDLPLAEVPRLRSAQRSFDSLLGNRCEQSIIYLV
jgi:hypothetical protein